MPLSGMHPSTGDSFFFISTSLYCKPNYSSPFIAWDRPEVSLEQFSFLEKFFNKTKLEVRTWAKLVNLDTLH